MLQLWEWICWIYVSSSHWFAVSRREQELPFDQELAGGRWSRGRSLLSWAAGGWRSTQASCHEHPNSFKTVFLLLRQRNNARGLNANYITETITPKIKRETRNALRAHSHTSQRTRKDQDANSSVAFFLLAAGIFFTTKDAQRGPSTMITIKPYHPTLFASVLYSSHVILSCAEKAICQV